MPIIQEHRINRLSHAIWRIEEPEIWFLEQLQLSEIEATQLEPIKGWRRIEWLAVRQLVATLVPGKERSMLVKDEHGKPFLHNSPQHVSISHSHELAAAIIADEVVGIDIQKVVEKIERIAERFLNAEELKFISPSLYRLEQLHVCWSAKEALYKAYGKRELDFCCHLLLDPFVYQPEGGRFKGRVNKGAYDQTFELHYSMIEQCILVTAVIL